MKTVFTILACLVLFQVTSFAKNFTLAVDSRALLHAVSLKENAAQDPEAVGDKHMKNKAYGLLQIRAPYLQDVNRIAGSAEVRRVWGKDELTLLDMKNKQKAEWACCVYLSHYGRVYTKKTGKVPTAEVYARIHNGGPNGWKLNDTREYAKTVLCYIQEYRSTTSKG